MAFNPFNEKPENLDKLFIDWQSIYPASYDKNEVSPFTKTRCILMNGAEFEAVWFLHQFHRHCPDNDVRRELAIVRRGEQQQQKRLACIKPKDETVLETTISYEQLAVELTALLARRAKDDYVKQALDFALLEDFDHLYRYANLLDMEHGVHAEKLVGGYTDITPGRPTIAHHRHPNDEVKRWVDFKTADPLTKLDVSIITAAEQQTMNYYMNQAGFYTSDLGRRLYQEIGMVEEQHVSQYGSLIDVNTSWLECWLNHEYTECYLYYSCFEDECDKNIKKIWEMHLIEEIAHLHRAAEVLKRVEGKEWNEVITVGEFPELIKFVSQKDYVAKILKTTVEHTALKEDYTSIDKLPQDADFYKYQNQIIRNVNMVASHSVIDMHISKCGEDYRAEANRNPVAQLRSRTEDNTQLGRKKL